MIIGFTEILLIAAVLIIIFLPGLLRSKKKDAQKTLKIYAAIAILIVIVLILARVVYSLIGKLVAFTLIIIALIFISISRYFKR